MLGISEGALISRFDASSFRFSPEAHMTSAQSLVAIQTVLSASFGCIMYLRYVTVQYLTPRRRRLP